MNSKNKVNFTRCVAAHLCVMICGAICILLCGVVSANAEIRQPLESDLSHLSYTNAFDKSIDLLAENYPFTEWKGINWETVRETYRPVIEQAEQQGNYNSFLLSYCSMILNTMHDGHVSVSPTHADAKSLQTLFNTIATLRGASVGMALATLTETGTVVVSSVTPGGSADQAGLQIGDEILEWNGLTIEEALGSIDKVWSFDGIATTEETRVLREQTIAFVPENTAIRVRYIPNGQFQEKQAILQSVKMDAEYVNVLNKLSMTHPFQGEEDLNFRWLQGGVAYVGIRDLNPDEMTEESAMKEVATYSAWFKRIQDSGMKELIVDLRGNGGGIDPLGADFVSYFANELEFYNQNMVWDEDIQSWIPDPQDPYAVSWIKPKENRFRGHTVVLIDSNTISAGEGLAYHLKRMENVELMGVARTNGSFGWVGPYIILPGDIALSFPGGISADQNGTIMIDTNANGEGGVSPDHLIEVTKETLQQSAVGKDVVLEKAVSNLVNRRTQWGEETEISPTILSVIVNNQFVPMEIDQPASSLVPAKTQRFNWKIGVNESLQMKFVWNWRQDPSSFSIMSGDLPQGLSLDENGVISGSPQQSGEFVFVVSVMDFRGRCNQRVSLVVEP